MTTSVVLDNPMSVRAAADAGMDMVNVLTGEFYSFSRYRFVEGNVVGVYGLIATSALAKVESRVTEQVGSTELMLMLEAEAVKSGARLTPRYNRNDGHAISLKEATRIAANEGWVSAQPEVVFDKPGLGRPLDKAGPFVKRVEQLDEMDKMWASSAFYDKRSEFASDLEKLGLDPSRRGNPITKAQCGYIFDMEFSAFGYEERLVPKEVAELAAARVFSSHEATLVIDACERALNGEQFEIKDVSKRSAMIEKAHDGYAERHGGFVPVSERAVEQDNVEVDVGDVAIDKKNEDKELY